MEITKGLKKVLVCGVALLSLGTCASGINNVNASHVHHARVVKVNKSYAIRVYNKVTYILMHRDINGKHNPLSHSLKSQFVKVMPKLSFYQLYCFHTREYSSYLTKQGADKFNKLYHQRFLQHTAKHPVTSDASKLIKHTMTPTERAIAKADLHDINAEREQNGLKPLQLTYGMQRIANIRAKQVYKVYTTNANPTDNQTHGINQYGIGEAGRLAYKLGFTNVLGEFDVSENANDFKFGNHETYQDHGHTYSYKAKTPKQLADAFNNAYMNHDLDSQNGHRESILDNTSTKVGIAVKYDPNSKQIATVEDFI